MDLDFLLDTDGNADRVGLGLVFVHGVADGDLVLLVAGLRDADREVHDPSLLYRNNLADRHLASAVFLTAELNLVVVLLLRSNHLADLSRAGARFLAAECNLVLVLLLRSDGLADLNGASPSFLAAELNWVFVLLLRGNHLTDLDGA